MDGNLSNRMPTRGAAMMDQLAVNLNAMLDRIQALMEPEAGVRRYRP
jgi:hypothetical protein